MSRHCAFSGVAGRSKGVGISERRPAATNVEITPVHPVSFAAPQKNRKHLPAFAVIAMASAKRSRQVRVWD